MKIDWYNSLQELDIKAGTKFIAKRSGDYGQSPLDKPHKTARILQVNIIQKRSVFDEKIKNWYYNSHSS